MHVRPAIILFALLLAGCATAPPARIVQTPAICPAPRQPPTAALGAVDSLPPTLPALPAKLTPAEAADALHAAGAADAHWYHVARTAAAALAAWIRDGAKP
ncbi:MAG TPA: hypothetical protein VFG73_02140 [Rhodanobacteraceae bacterium]|nr:hypothetical protein [Rhodanobacteraceae bacterium]